MFLVMLIHTMDDLPIRLFADEKAAYAFAKKLKAMPTKAIRDLYSTDCSTPCGVRIVRFNRTGNPIDIDYVKKFD